MASARLAPIAEPAERDGQHGADGAAYRDNQCRGMVIGGSTRQDQDDALAQAHTALGQAESLAPPFLWCCADESGVGGQLIGSEEARCEQDQQREEKAGTKREEDEDR